MYQAGDLCVETAHQVYAFVASRCSPVSGGQAVSCLATDTGVQVTIGQTTTTVTPVLVDCADPLDTIALAWLVVAVLVVAWAYRTLGESTK